MSHEYRCKNPLENSTINLIKHHNEMIIYRDQQDFPRNAGVVQHKKIHVIYHIINTIKMIS